MTPVIEFCLQQIIPSRNEVLLMQGIPDPASEPLRIQNMPDEGIEEFEQTAKPRGVISELSKEKFGVIFEGEGNNADDVLLADIYPQGDKLALFALTMGDEVSRRIGHLFKENEFVAASMLDTVASLATEAAVKVLEKNFSKTVLPQTDVPREYCTLSYSPGYCGWDITAQRKMFDYLSPEQIGITLNDSCLMIPLKSLTGILIFGRQETHIFEPAFSYCETCEHRSCMERQKKLKSGETLDI